MNPSGEMKEKIRSSQQERAQELRELPQQLEVNLTSQQKIELWNNIVHLTESSNDDVCTKYAKLALIRYRTSYSGVYGSLFTISESRYKHLRKIYNAITNRQNPDASLFNNNLYIVVQGVVEQIGLERNFRESELLKALNYYMTPFNLRLMLPPDREKLKGTLQKALEEVEKLSKENKKLKIDLALERSRNPSNSSHSSSGKHTK